MMKSGIIALSAAALLSVNVAHAGTIFDNINGVATAGYDGPAADVITVMADSFTTAATDFTVGLNLQASSPTDGGSFAVYLVADDGSGGTTGTAGLPVGFGTGNYTGGLLLGTVNDSALAATPSVLTFDVNTNAASSLNTANQEYWVAVVAASATSSSVGWTYAGDGSGIGTTNQLVGTDYNDGVTVGPFNTAPDSVGPYQLSVVPEPASIGLLGAGLTALGFFRRRKSISA